MRITPGKLKILMTEMSLFAAYTVVVLLLIPAGLSFWVSYGFLAFSVLALLSFTALSEEPFDAEKMPYREPLLRTLFLYVLAELVLNVAFGLGSGIPVKLLIAAEVGISAIFGARCVAVHMAVSDAERQRNGQKWRAAVLRESSDMVKAAAEKTEDPVLKRKLLHTAEDIRLSPALTDGRLAAQDDIIRQMAESLGEAAERGDAAALARENDRLAAALKGRNRAAGRS